MTHTLCWRDQHDSTHRAIMSRAAAERFARVMTAIFPQWPAWTEVASIEGDDA